ncbi:LamG-like jellyroll fold domain-containing protein [Pedobacter sp. UBA4863]|uniref:LamG-like jellyroll fold domain-containing protein n=1 Tax=Pedobacter sp. UBA4863 TaxID=1947060 RepID=UPI0025D68A6C|nr:LamG-like jellyroll fold domain-containing protein [Pedobacter sp. UBA4863]
MKKLFTLLSFGLFAITTNLKAQTITTYAGSTQGYADGIGAAAQFYHPYGIAHDGGGAVIVTDAGNNRVRMIYSNQQTALRAGSGNTGNINGTGAAAWFGSLGGIARDGFNNAFICDASYHVIKKITSAGVVTTVAGSGTVGNTNATGTAAQFNTPYGIASDANGVLYVADTYNHRIRKITTAGVVTTLAGGSPGYVDDTGIAAKFTFPKSIAIDAANNVYVGENTMVRKITPAGVVTTLATGFNGVEAIVVDNSGNLYIADAFNFRIKKITPAGVVTNYAGTGVSGSTDGDVSVAAFGPITGMAIDKSTNILYLADHNNNRIRKIMPAGAATAPVIGSTINAVAGVFGADISYTLTANNASTTSIIKYGLANNALTSQKAGFSAVGETPTSQTVSVSGLQSNTTYYYQIEATNSEGTVASSILSFTTDEEVNGPVTAGLIEEFKFNTAPFTGEINPSIMFGGNGTVTLVAGRTNNPGDNAIHIERNATATTNIPNLPYSNNPRSFSFWVKLDEYSAVAGGVLNFVFAYGTPFNNQANGISVSATNTIFLGHANDYSVANPTPLNTWTHIVATYDGTTAKIYNNGVLKGSQAIAWNTVNNNNSFLLGVSANGENWFQGAIDDFKIYNREISSTEVGYLYNGVLPVNLVSFTAKAQNNAALLNWETASETNNSHFVIKRSTDGVEFNEVAKIGAKDANGANYQYVDNSPAGNTNYYQLLQVDLDGKTTDLGVKTVSFSIKDAVKVFPNPTADKAEITFNAGSYHNAKLTDMNGKVLLSISISKLQQGITLNVHNYPKGLYLLHLTGEKENSTQKIIKH